MKSLSAYAEEAVSANASDIHLVGGEKPMMRVAGELRDLEDAPVEDAALQSELASLLSEKQKKEFEETMELDMSSTIAGARFRLNLHRQDGRVGVAARRIPAEIPSPEMLQFTPAMSGCMNLLDGLVLVTGPTGSGKSTVIASMIEEINKTRKAHVVTIEDPIEFLFQDKMSLIEQREVGADTPSFASALKHVLRQDPNVIFVGEMRDPETIATALTAAETGHLVFSTLHTGTAAEAVERIADAFDGARQRQVLVQLAAVLRVVIAQELLPAAQGGLVPAREILVNTPAVSNLIRENNIAQIKSAIQTGANEGMVTMENSIAGLLSAGAIAPDVAEKRTMKQKKI